MGAGPIGTALGEEKKLGPTAKSPESAAYRENDCETPSLSSTCEVA
jgi:hypothetical protein